MTDASLFRTSTPARKGWAQFSMGLKLIIVCALALTMTIPALFVDFLVDERADRAKEVVKEISNHVGGQQTFLGPTLAVPYGVPGPSPGTIARRGVYLIFPVQASASIKTRTEQRRRSLFKVPVFQADIDFTASFDLHGIPRAAPQNVVLDWTNAEFIVGVTDARGALADGQISEGGKTKTLEPASVAQNLSFGADLTRQLKLTLFGAKADIQPDAQFTTTAALRFGGAQRIAMLAYGKSTHLTVQGDWPNPSFDGGFLPATHGVVPAGFTAEWNVPFIARGVRAEGTDNSLSGLESTDLGVSFVELADPYQSVTRSLKYALLLIGLVFLSYFIFEVTTNRRVHPAQYLLVGIAQIIFYLLLLSLAERIGFDLGFLIGGSATVALLSVNAGWIFRSRRQAFRAAAGFSLLYGLIYELLRLEDNALLAGAIASFLLVAAAMYLTRSIDWYGSLPESAATDQTRP